MGSSDDRMEKALQLVLSFLPNREIFRCQRVSKLWQAAANASLESVIIDKDDDVSAIIEAMKTKHVLHFKANFNDNVTDDLVKQLPPSLLTLNLDACQQVTNAGLRGFKGKKLESISLYWNVKYTDAGIVTILNNNRTTLTRINLSGCQLLEDRSCEAIIACKKCRYLDLTRCKGMSDYGLSLVCEQLGRKLKSLIMYASAQFTEASFKSFRHLKNLEEIDLCGTMVGDEQLALLAQTCGKTLKILNLTWVVKITDKSLVAIAEHCDKLEWLSIFGNKQFSTDALNKFAHSANRLTLKAFDMHGIPNGNELTKDHCAGLHALMPRLKELHLHS